MSRALKKRENTTNRILYHPVNANRAHFRLSKRGFPMTDESLPQELALALERHEWEQDRIVKSEGYGSHAKSLALIQQSIDKFGAPFHAPI
jgi:hypothetical protein